MVNKRKKNKLLALRIALLGAGIFLLVVSLAISIHNMVPKDALAIVGALSIPGTATRITAISIMLNNEDLSSALNARLKATDAATIYAPKANPIFTGTVTFPSPFTLGATSVTATGTELNYMSGVTSAVQTQLGTKAPTANPIFTGNVTLPGGIWNSGGNVGIGTTAPGAKLHVAGSDDSAWGINSYYFTPTLSTGNRSIIVVGRGAASNQSGFFGYKYDGAVTNNNYLFLGVYGGTEQLVINPSGNVGIGTTAPASDLSFGNGADRTIGIDASSPGNGKNLTIGSGSGGASGTGGGLTLKTGGGATGGGNLLIETDSNYKAGDINITASYGGQSGIVGGNIYITSGNGAPGGGVLNLQTGKSAGSVYAPMSLNASGGNVGIGTTAPNQMLDVNGWGRFKGNGGGNRSDSGAIEFFNSGASSLNVQAQVKGLRGINDWKAGQLGFFTSAASTGTLSERMTIDEIGNVGIGTTNPATSLHIIPNANGGVRVEGVSGSITPNISTFLGGTQYGTMGTSAQADVGFTGAAIGDMFIKNQANSPILFGTNALERMRITSSGNVGIGTTNPGQKLDVMERVRSFNPSGSGVVLFPDGAAANNYSSMYIFTIDQANAATYGLTNPGTEANVMFRTQNWNSTFVWGNYKSPGTLADFQEKMRIDVNGNVGIGTAAPAAGLDIAVATSSYFQKWTRAGAVLGTIYKNTGTPLTFESAANGSTLAGFDFEGGNVGIGTGGPSTKLHVVAAGSAGTVAEALRLDNSEGGFGAGAGTGLSFWYANAGTQKNLGTINGLVYAADGSRSDMSFSTRNAETVTEKMRITTVGNVGIGTTAPAAKLDVNGTIKSNGAAVVNNNVNIYNASSALTLTQTYTDIPGMTVTFTPTYDEYALITVNGYWSNSGYGGWVGFQIVVNGAAVYTYQSPTIPNPSSPLTVNMMFKQACTSGTAYTIKVQSRMYSMGGSVTGGMQVWRMPQ